MKKELEELEITIDFLTENYPDLPEKVFVSLKDVKKTMKKACAKKRCKHCDRHEHYDETLGVWKCEQCDKKK